MNFNFEIFRGKEVILCPDNDEPGRKAMHTIAYHLVTKGITENIKYFNVSFLPMMEKNAKYHEKMGILAKNPAKSWKK